MKSRREAIGILGAGSWGTALGVQLGNYGQPGLLWARSSELATRLQEERRNEIYLPGIDFPPVLTVTPDLEELAHCALVLVVVPSHGFRQVVRRFLTVVPRVRTPILVSGTKGIEGVSLARMSEVCLEEAVSAGRDVRFAVVSGPSFAEELARGSPTAAVAASQDPAVAQEVQTVLSKGNLRLYTTSDLVGVELGGTVKNVIAIAAGVVSGLELGHNSLAALITRGLHEMTRLGVACGGRSQTFAGLAGLGDLVVTCTGRLSRNRRTGEGLARGKSLDESRSTMPMVAEGVRNSLAVYQLAQERGIEMPITEQMVEVLYEEKSPRLALEELMSRELKSESEM